MSRGLLPDAYLHKDGRILDIETSVELPNYEGLCLAVLVGGMYIMRTWLFGGDRHWEVFNEGSSIDA